MDVVSFVCCVTADAADVVVAAAAAAAAVVAIAANRFDANGDIDESAPAPRIPFSIASELLFNANADVDPYRRSTKLRLCVGDWLIDVAFVDEPMFSSVDANVVADSVVVRVELVDMVCEVGDDRFTGIVAAVPEPLLCKVTGVAGDVVSRTESSTVSFDSLRSRTAASLPNTGDDRCRTSLSTVANASSSSSA